jgi:hypothetical protein
MANWFKTGDRVRLASTGQVVTIASPADGGAVVRLPGGEHAMADFDDIQPIEEVNHQQLVARIAALEASEAATKQTVADLLKRVADLEARCVDKNLYRAGQAASGY